MHRAANERELLEKRLMELDAQLDSIDAAQSEPPSPERLQLRRQLCEEHVQLDKRLQELIATTPSVPEVKQAHSQRRDLNLRRRQLLTWEEALQRALSESSRPLTVEEIAHVIKQGAWMRDSAPIDEFTVRSAIDRLRTRLGIVKIPCEHRRNLYWLAGRCSPDAFS